MKRHRACVVVAFVFALLAVAAGSARSAEALVPSGDDGWFWQMPQPMGGSLVDADFGAAGHVWAVGDGRIVHSSDAGVTWQIQVSYEDTDLRAVTFLDEREGYVCGRRLAGGASLPLLLATNDGGATWTEATPPGAVGTLLTVAATNGERLWVSGTRGQLWTTLDGGATWTKRPVDTYAARLVACTSDALSGWAAGNDAHLWCTTDGGATWRRQATGLAFGYDIAQVACLDADHAWLLAIRAAENRISSSVLATTDGGATWRSVFHSSAQVVSDLYAVSPSELWLVSPNMLPSVLLAFDGGAASSMRHTVDGGATWSYQSLHSSYELSALAGSDASLCAVGSGVFTSSDRGQTWLSQTSGGSHIICSADAVSSTDVWAVDIAGAVLHSSDGVSWSELDAPRRWSQALLGVSFPDAESGWVVGTTESGDEPLILHTGDGGATWTEQTSALSGDLVGVDFVDGLRGWAISDYANRDGSVVERTTDGGATWTAQRPRAEIYGLNAIDFIDADTGWVAGQCDFGGFGDGLVPGAVFHTSDGGVTWTTHRLPKDVVVEQLEFLDGTHGWALAAKYTSRSSSRFVMLTSDAGATWTRLSTLPSGTPLAMHFLDAQTGWFALYGKGTYETTDGGATWQCVADSAFTLAITAADADHVWALGLGSALGTVDTQADTAPPSTWAATDGEWRRTAQTLTLTPNDIGGAGLAATEYSLDMGESWQPGTSVAFGTPDDHSNDGVHTVLYRSTDNAGNREATQLCTERIDTLGPTCAAPKKAVVNAGSRGILRFWADDATSGVMRATITLTDLSGRVRRTFVKYAGNWGASPAPTYYWLRFTCDLKPGYYRIAVTATDRAGNMQIKVGRNWLHVVRRGAPKQTPPWWPSGLPDTSMSGWDSGSTGGSAGGLSPAAPLGARLSPSLLRVQLRAIEQFESIR